MDKIIYWIWLSLSCTPDSATFPKLLSKFDDVKDIYDADIKEISRAIGFRTSDRARLADKDLTRATEIYDFCKKYGVGLLPYSDQNFPKSLREIPTPPVLLYYRGILPDFNSQFFVACVGTRMLTDYGRRSAFSISYDLAMAGATIVSGMAVGIDSVAHAAALSAGATTVAILGSGIDICYPSEHLHLAREIVKSGCILTEYPPKSQPTKFSFPKRNRIISGLSSATVVIEGRERSGAVITARHAKSQGKVVYALPGNVGNRNSEATNLLIRNGAKIITRAEDLINDFADKHPLNPFLLKPKCPVDLMDVLSAYRVSALCQSDDVFVPARASKKRETPTYDYSPNRIPQNSAAHEPPEGFDVRALAIYKKIPTSGECTVESLIDSEHSLREVMRCLLKLEIGQFIIMLPGERVARKTK